MRYEINASGSSTKNADISDWSNCNPLRAVTVSNQASITSIVAVMVAGMTNRRDCLRASQAVVNSMNSSPMSKPTQAASQCEDRWFSGSSMARYIVQGTVITANRAYPNAAQLGTSGCS